MPGQAVGAPDVLAVLDLLAGAGVEAWVDGGWGVDALVGAVTRTHSDVDLVVPLPAVDRALGAGRGRLRGVLRDWRPTAVAVADQRGREVDLHLVTPAPDGGATRRCRTAARSTTRRRSLGPSAGGRCAAWTR